MKNTNIKRDQILLESLIEKYGKLDVVKYIKRLDESNEKYPTINVSKAHGGMEWMNPEPIVEFAKKYINKNLNVLNNHIMDLTADIFKSYANLSDENFDICYYGFDDVKKVINQVIYNMRDEHPEIYKKPKFGKNNVFDTDLIDY